MTAAARPPPSVCKPHNDPEQEGRGAVAFRDGINVRKQRRLGIGVSGVCLCLRQSNASPSTKQNRLPQPQVQARFVDFWQGIMTDQSRQRLGLYSEPQCQPSLSSIALSSGWPLLSLREFPAGHGLPVQQRRPPPSDRCSQSIVMAAQIHFFAAIANTRKSESLPQINSCTALGRP